MIAEQCYEQLLNEIRSEIVHAKNDRKFKKAYKMLLNILDEYNVNLLSTKIYWEKPKDREQYKKFWEEYKKIEKIENDKEKELKKEILYIRKDLKQLLQEEKRYKLVISAYKKKLVELGAMKTIKSTYKLLGKAKYTKLNKTASKSKKAPATRKTTTKKPTKKQGKKKDEE